MSDLIQEPAVIESDVPATPTEQLSAEPETPATPEGDENKETSETPEPEATPEELPEGVTKEGDSYVMKLEGSTYKASSIQALLTELGKGLNAKQALIRETKARGAIKVPKDFDKPEGDSVDDEQWADEGKIRDSQFAKANIDPRLASYSEEQWEDLKETHKLNDYQMFSLRQKVDAAKQTVSAEVTKQNVKSANLYQVKLSESAVQKMIAKAGLDPDEFGHEYVAVLHDVWKDPTAKDRYGMISSADIVTRMFERILPKLTQSQTTVIEKKVRDEKVKAEAVKRAVGGAASAGAKPSHQSKPVANLKEAGDALRARIKRGEI